MNKRNYYQQFKGWKSGFYVIERENLYLDPTEILFEERSKKICNQWNQTGSCSFGENCKYSHRSIYELMQLKEDHFLSNNFNVNRWIEKKLSYEIILPQSLAS